MAQRKRARVLQKSYTFALHFPKFLYIGGQLVQNGTCRSRKHQPLTGGYLYGILDLRKLAPVLGFGVIRGDSDIALSAKTTII